MNRHDRAQPCVPQRQRFALTLQLGLNAVEVAFPAFRRAVVFFRQYALRHKHLDMIVIDDTTNFLRNAATFGRPNAMLVKGVHDALEEQFLV